MSGIKRMHDDLDVTQDFKKMKSKDQLIAAARRGDLGRFKSLITDGADIEQHGHECLMAACRNDNDKIVSYLIQSGVDINKITEYDDFACCSLHRCVISQSLRCFKLLLDNGAQLQGISSLTRASKIEALECMGVMSVMLDDFPLACGYWLKSLEERAKEKPGDLIQPKTNETHRAYAMQFKTAEDLDRIASSPKDMWMQAFVVFEQIDCWEDLSEYYTFAGRAFDRLGDKNYRTRIWISISMYILDRQLEVLHQDIGQSLEMLAYTIESLSAEETPVPYEEVMALLSKAVHITELAITSPDIAGRQSELQMIDEAITLVLYSVGFLVKARPQMSEMDQINFKQRISKFVHLNPVETVGKRSPLRVCTAQSTSFPIFKVVELLLQAGANPQAVDRHGNTPLHSMAMDRHPAKHRIIKLMLSECCSCVFHTRNKVGKRFTDYLPSEMVREIEESCDVFCTLMCLSAKAVVNNKIPFESVLPTCLTKLVKVHAIAIKNSCSERKYNCASKPKYMSMQSKISMSAFD